MEERNISESIGKAIESYYTNKLTQAEAEELIGWLGVSEDNRSYFREIGIIWYASGQLSKKEFDAEKGWANLLEKIGEDDIRPMPKPALRIPLSVIYRVAAAAVLIAVLGIGGLLIFNRPEVKSEIAYFEALAPKGSRSFITLSDGSTVWLNSGTRLRYQQNFGNKSRDLYLEGEAYFVVARNPELPFRVKTSDVCITAIGTEFNVKAYLEEGTVETTLERGEVKIETLEGSKHNSGQTPVILKPNQKAVFVKNNKNLSVGNSVQKSAITRNDQSVKVKPVPIKVESLVDTKLTTSWKDSRWIFKSEKLIRLAPILERRYDISISFRDSVLRSYKFTGTLKEESLEQVLNAICMAAPIRYEIIHNKVIFFENFLQKNKYHKPQKDI